LVDERPPLLGRLHERRGARRRVVRRRPGGLRLPAADDRTGRVGRLYLPPRLARAEPYARPLRLDRAARPCRLAEAGLRDDPGRGRGDQGEDEQQR
jgi:hypothetical protein